MRFWQRSWIGITTIVLATAIMRRLTQLGRRRALPGVSASLTPYKCPPPTVVHRRIEQVKPGRLIIVGDLHGTPELFRLLDNLRYDAASDNLILAGDLVNKGPVSLAILDAVPKLGCWAVRGNHDDAALAAWLKFRSGQSLSSKFEWARDMTDDQAAVLIDLPFTVSVPEYGIAVVHAGFVPGVPMELQDMWAMYKMRNLVRVGPEGEGRESLGGGAAERASEQLPGGDGGAAPDDAAARYRAVEKAKEGGDPWAAMWHGPPHVFFGHDARRRLQLHPHATGLDTGCVYGGQLTAAVMPPLAELRARSPGFVAKMVAGEAVTREDLMAEIVAVRAAETYSQPTGTGPTAGAAAAEAVRAATGQQETAAAAAAADVAGQAGTGTRMG